MDEVLCLGGLTALEYWRQVRMRVAAANVPCDYQSERHCSKTAIAQYCRHAGGFCADGGSRNA